MSPQAFVSYSTEDKDTVNSICQVLEENAVRCWYAPRNVPIGADWDVTPQKISLKRGEAEAARKREDKQDLAMKKLL